MPACEPVLLREGHCLPEPDHRLAVPARLEDPHDAERPQSSRDTRVNAPRREMEGGNGDQVHNVMEAEHGPGLSRRGSDPEPAVDREKSCISGTDRS